MTLSQTDLVLKYVTSIHSLILLEWNNVSFLAKQFLLVQVSHISSSSAKLINLASEKAEVLKKEMQIPIKITKK
mgnify:CR=1 FL=1